MLGDEKARKFFEEITTRTVTVNKIVKDESGNQVEEMVYKAEFDRLNVTISIIDEADAHMSHIAHGDNITSQYLELLKAILERLIQYVQTKELNIGRRRGEI